MASKRKIAVVGNGSWGTSVANVLCDAGHDVVLWGRDAAFVDSFSKSHENKKYLPGIALHKSLRASDDLAKELSAAQIVVCSVPTQKIREVFAPQKKKLAKKIVVNTAQGIETGTHARVSEVFAEIDPSIRYAVLSGPSFALEVAKRLPTAVTIAAKDKALVAEVQALFRTPYFRAYGSNDLVGVELAGALKNIIAIASGIVSGLGLGYNSQAAIINRGIVEMVRLAREQKAESLTFLGLAGMGDLVLTCTGPLSRNRKLGEALGRGMTLEQAIPVIGGVAEGAYTAKAVHDLTKKHPVDLPIMDHVYRILYEGMTPQKALTELMSRDLRDEWEPEAKL